VTRPGLRAAVLGCLVSGAVVLLAQGRTWARIDGAFGPRAMSGRVFTGALTTLGLVALAGVVAVAATRRRSRVPVGLALAVCGAAVVAIALDAIRDTEGPVYAAYRAPAAVGEVVAVAPVAWPVHETAWPYATVGAGLLLAATGVLVAVRGPRWAALGARYDAPTAPRPRTDADLWSALDRGEDPTT
jgi:uncharacterized membrane protein (TIGR02234 family)